MKKTRIFAGLTALLCCVQAGFTMTAPVNALDVIEMTTEGESDTYVIEEESQNTQEPEICQTIRNFMTENQLTKCNFYYDQPSETIYITVSCYPAGWAGETEDTIAEKKNQLELIKTYCEEQGFTDQYQIQFEASQLEIAVEEEPETQPSSEIVAEFKAGDVNLDYTVNVLDVITLNRAILGKDILTGMQNQTADMNQDGSIDSSDSLAILKYIVGIASTEEEKDAILKAVNLGASVQSEAVEGKQLDQNFITAQTGFYLDILKHAEKTSPEENVLVSPYSVMQALAMTANGANGQTRSEMESALGGIALDDLNQYLYTQRVNQPNSKECKLSTANSIWYRQDENNLNVSQNFLQTNANYYAADAFSAPFDASTVKDINTWVDQKTDHMIDKLLENINDDVMLYLINAVAFDGKWIDQYEPYSVHEKEFTALDGSAQTVDMMYSGNESFYLEDENATGFYKYYQDGRYAFAALLPNEGVSVDDYVSGLTADSLHQTLANPERIETHTAIPKFSYDYEITLNDTLSDMGMPTAFDEVLADFSDMAALPDGRNLYIGRVLHKTHIEMTEAGTRAAAVTAVETCAAEAIMEPPQYKTVYLDRPFVYMIVDTESYLPVFMGTVKSIEK